MNQSVVQAIRPIANRNTQYTEAHLKMCYNIIHNEIAILNDDFFVFSKLTHTRGHNYKLSRAIPGSIHISISFLSLFI